MRLSPNQSPGRMYRSMAILVSHGCRSSSAAAAGKRSIESSTTRRCGRVTPQSRRMSRGSYAFPRSSGSSSCGGLDMAPALLPSRARARAFALAASADDCLRSLIGQLLLDLLDAPEPRVEPARGEESGVSPLLDHAPAVEHHDLVRFLRHPQPVGHQERGAPGHGGTERAEDLDLLARVHRREDVVEHEDGRLGHARAREGAPPALAARQRQPALPDHGRPALGKALDLATQPRSLRGRAHASLWGALVPERHVVADRAREEERLLRHVADGSAEALAWQLPHVAPSD